jgi:hypothetical protein
MKLGMIIGFGAAICVAACAPKPGSIQGTYTSSAQYESLSCPQLAAEAQNVSNRAHDAAQLQRRHRTDDKVAVTVGLVIFWPALFFTHGNDATSAELAQLKGEMEAVERASDAKRCGIVFDRV